MQFSWNWDPVLQLAVLSWIAALKPVCLARLPTLYISCLLGAIVHTLTHPLRGISTLCKKYLLERS